MLTLSLRKSQVKFNKTFRSIGCGDPARVWIAPSLLAQVQDLSYEQVRTAAKVAGKSGA